MTYFATQRADLAPKVVGLLGFDGVATLDLTGPLEVLATARRDADECGAACYKPVVIGLTNRVFVSESGFVFRADQTIERVAAIDTLIIPGGTGLRQPESNRRVAAWVATQARQVRRIASVSTGIYGLAPSGLLDGRHVTTHWRFARDLAQRFPKLRVSQTASFLKDESFYTSAAGTAGIEMTLALIEEDFGGPIARGVAREFVMRLRPPGDEEHRFDPANYQSDPAERISDLPAWIVAHLHENLTVQALAARACLCPRHFSRLFKQVFNCTPADFVEELRLSEARRRLLGLRSTVESVAESVGFKSSDAFRRAFERRVGVTPTAFRRHGGGCADRAASTKVVGRACQLAHDTHGYPKEIAA
jgi:transcriptional regulator GlxA family with amidase domain